jgi:hypothetical protein
MYQNSDYVVKRNLKEKSPPSKTEGGAPGAVEKIEIGPPTP